MSSLPLIQHGSFSGFADFKVAAGRFLATTPWRNIKGAGDASDVYVDGLPTFGVSLTGTAGAAAHIPAQACALSLGALSVAPHALALAKRWTLDDVTGSAAGVTDAEKVFRWGDPHYSGSLQGWVTDAALLTAAAGSTFDADLRGIGRIQGTAVYARKTIGLPFGRGGAIPVSLSFHLSGAVVQSVSPPAVATLYALDSTQRDPTAGALTLDTGGGVITHHALAYGLVLKLPLRDGGPIELSVDFMFSKAP